MKKELKGLKPLSENEILEKMKLFPGWKYSKNNGNKISKEFEFKDFTDILDFLEKLIPYCNKIDHHPDTHIYFRKVVFELTRYDIGGKVAKEDFEVAKKIEDLYKSWPK